MKLGRARDKISRLMEIRSLERSSQSSFFRYIYIYIFNSGPRSRTIRKRNENLRVRFSDETDFPVLEIDGKKSIEIDRFPFRSYERAWKYFFFFFSRSVKWSDKLNFVFYYRLINREESLFSCLYSYTGPTFAEFIGGSEYSLHSRYYSVAARKNEQNNCCSIVRTFVTNARPSERSHSEKAVT